MSEYRNDVEIWGAVGSVKMSENRDGTRNYTFQVATETTYVIPGHACEVETVWHTIRLQCVSADSASGPAIMNAGRGDFIRCHGQLRVHKYTNAQGSECKFTFIEGLPYTFEVTYHKPR